MSAHALKEVVVTGVREEAIRHTALSIQVLPAEKIAASAAPTLALALTEVPGVQRLGTGQGIGKPVLRGLSATGISITCPVSRTSVSTSRDGTLPF